MNLKEMLAAQKRLLDTARAENRSFTDKEQREFDDLTSKIETSKAAAVPVPATAEKKDAEDIAEKAVKAERVRTRDLTSLCESFPELGFKASEVISDKDMTPDSLRSMIIEKQIQDHQPTAASVSKDEGDKFREAASDGMLLRSNISLTGSNAEERTEAAGHYRGLTLERLAIDCLEREGVKTSGLSRTELFDNLMSRQYLSPSAAFPSIMDQVINKAYVEGYAQAPATFDQWVKIGTLTDFKKTKGEYVAGAAGEFLEVAENGELKLDVPNDYERPEKQLKTYGRQFTMTRQAFINDDIGFITTLPARYAAAAKRTINKQVYTVLYNNGTIFDDKALFATDHNNVITTGAAPDKDTYKAIRKLIRKQKGLDGEALNLNMTQILIPQDWETELKEILFSQTISTDSITNKYNPFYGDNVQVISDDTIAVLAGESPCPWFAASKDAPSIEVDYLNGQDTPTINRSQTSGTLGFVWDIFLDWGVSVVDFRGLAKNPGVNL